MEQIKIFFSFQGIHREVNVVIMNANIEIHHPEITTAGGVHEMRIFRDPDEIMLMIIRGGIRGVIGLRNGTVSFQSGFYYIMIWFLIFFSFPRAQNFISNAMKKTNSFSIINIIAATWSHHFTWKSIL